MSFYDLDKILSTIEKNEYFVDFINTKSLEAGIIMLQEGQKDTQTSHPSDELYYVIRGEGYIRIEGKSRRVERGTFIYIPAKTSHYFYGNKGEFVILYLFPKHEWFFGDYVYIKQAAAVSCNIS
jgi:mannose-6-phosphate isomerase-like protein (cupin superfamily)